MCDRHCLFHHLVLRESVYCTDGRSANGRACSLRPSPAGTLAYHCWRSACQPASRNPSVLPKSKARVASEFVGSLHILVAGGMYVGMSSMALSEKEMCHLYNFYHRPFLFFRRRAGSCFVLYSFAVCFCWVLAHSVFYFVTRGRICLSPSFYPFLFIFHSLSPWVPLFTFKWRNYISKLKHLKN